MNWQAILVALGLATAPTPPAALYPAVKLAVIANHTTPTAHPFLLTNVAQAQALLAAGKTDPSVAMELKRLSVSVKQWAANAAAMTAWATPYSGTDLSQYQAQFSVVSNTSGGAAYFALDFAFYHMLYTLDPTFGDAATDTAAANEARAIIWNWASAGFRPAGNPLTSYTQLVGTDATGNAVSQNDVWSSVNLQIGRGVFPFTVAEDMMQASTPADRVSIINAFLVNMRDMLIGAANEHYTASPYMDCHRYDNQADTGMTDLLALGWFTGDMDLVRDLAGDPTAPKLLLWTWPQQIEGQIYGTGESARTCNATTTASDKYNPTAALGEITDRERNEPHQAFGYTGGSMGSLMFAGHMFRDLGYDAYHFKGAHGQGIQAALDYYAQFYTTYAALGPVSLPATDASIPDFAQYAGDAYTSSAPGADVTGGGGLIMPYLLGSTVYPGDAKIAAALAKDTALYQQELAATGSKTVWLPHSNPDIISLVMQGSAGD